MGYLKKRSELSKIRERNKGRGRGVACKKGLAFLVSDKRKTGDGVVGLPKRKKAGRLQVYLLSLDNVPTHVPCLVHTRVHAYCLCLSLSPLVCSCLPGEI